jgi:[methyl-Co(III) methanol-specific corrinoid protein]:coenzyme M methyltransferase
MTSRERFLAALHGREPDRPPLAHVAALTTVELQVATGCFMPDVHHNPARLARLLAANHEVLVFDAVTFIINYFNEPAALGVEMDWGLPDTLPVYKSHPWLQAGDAVIPANLLDRPPVSTYLETVKAAKRDYGERMAVLGKVMGPFSMVQVMHGVENVMIGLIEDPGKIRAFLDVAVDILVACGNAQFALGVDALAIGEGGAGANMISPEMHETILLPVHQRMVSRLNGPTIMHICGDIMPRLHLLGNTGFTCFNFDRAIPPKVMAEAAAGRFTVMGNVNTADLLNAQPTEIERQVVENIEAAVHIIGPGCAISPRCPNANLRAMADAIQNVQELRKRQ